MRQKRLCRAYARSTGNPCRCIALKNGRCRLHGGLSTGPKTIQGKSKVSEATRDRMANGQLQLAKEGFQRWLVDGGRERLRRLAKMHHQRREWLSLI